MRASFEDGGTGSQHPCDCNNEFLANFLQSMSDAEVLRHFLGVPILGAPALLNEAAIVSLDAEWWMYEPNPTTELGVAELLVKGLIPEAHANNILTEIFTAHVRVIPHAHLRNSFQGAGDPETLHFGTTKFVTQDEAKQVLIDTFIRQRHLGGSNELQPIIMIGHAVGNAFDHLQRAFGIDLRSYGTVVKIIDTQMMAQAANIKGPKGPVISLKDLLTHFNIVIPNLHTAGNDATGTLVAAVLLALKNMLYPGITGKPPVVVDGLEMQHVINGLRAYSKEHPVPVWGKEIFCTRCDRENHVRADCFAKLQCEICQTSGVKRLFATHKTHATSRCLYQYQPIPPRDFFPNGWQA